MFINATEDPNRNKVDPDVLANAPDITKDRVYDFLGRYVRWVHSNEFIRRGLKVNPKASYVDIIGPSDIVHVIAIITVVTCGIRTLG